MWFIGNRFYIFSFNSLENNMKRGTKIALIILGVVAIGVGAYMVISSRKNKSGNKEKDDKKIEIKRTL